MTRLAGKGATLMNETSLSGDTDGAQFALPDKKFDDVSATVEISNGNATVQIQGRISSDGAWIDLLNTAQTQATAAALYSLAYFPLMRVEVTSVTSTPDVRVEVYAG